MTAEQYAKWLLSLPENIRKMPYGVYSNRTDDNFISTPSHSVVLSTDGVEMLMVSEPIGDDPAPIRLSKSLSKTSLDVVMKEIEDGLNLFIVKKNL